jgi:Ca2+-binding RTX toxin-like protein
MGTWSPGPGATSGADTFTGDATGEIADGFAGADMLNGNDGNDDLRGGDGNDTLIGGAGDDLLRGNAGNDSMVGGGGNDAYAVESLDDQVIENPGEGWDAVYSTIGGTLAANVEELNLIGAGVGIGNDIANAIFADPNFPFEGASRLEGRGGDDYLRGSAVGDILNGGSGADIMDGRGGADIYFVDNVGDAPRENPNDGYDSVRATVNFTLGANIEQLDLGGAAVSGFGNALENVLNGNELNNYLFGDDSQDLLIGYAGDDILDGGVGADLLYGNSGNDVYIVDHIFEQVLGEQLETGWDAVYASVYFELPAGIEQLNLTGAADSARGNALANAMFGNGLGNYLNGEGGNDVLWGYDGDDILDGGAGGDALVGGVGGDSYGVDSLSDDVVEFANEGWDAIYASLDYTLGAHIEQLNLTGGALVGTGNGLDNALFGNGLANTLNGKDGADFMTGGAGDDRFVFDVGGGVDTIYDFVAGGTEDRLDLTAYAGTGITYTLAQSGADAVFTFSNGDQIVLVGVTAANLLQSGDFWL